MIAVDPAWLQVASGTHQPSWSARILTAAGDTVIDALPVVGGQITRDEGSTPRTTANVDVPTTAIPGLLDQGYLPTGNRLQLSWRPGPPAAPVVVADLDIAASAIARPEDMWTIAAVDPSARIAADDLARGSVPALTGTIAATITALILRTFPSTGVDATGPALTLPTPDGYGGTITDGSPWSMVEALAAEAESEVFHTVDRRAVIRRIPKVGTPVDALKVGAGGQLTGYVINHQLAYNQASIVYVNDTSGAVMRRGTWTDTRTTSPVAVQRVGSRVVLAEVVRATAAPSQAAADAAAMALGLRAGGKAREAELRHPTRPWLEPGDTIDVTYLGGPTEPAVIRSVGIDLGPANIQVTRLRNEDYEMGVPV